MIKRFCFDGGIPYPRNPAERRKVYAWMEICDNVIALPTKALVTKKLEQLDPEISRAIGRVIRSREEQIRDEQLESSGKDRKVA